MKEEFTLNRFVPYIDEFSFIGQNKDRIIICNPIESLCISPVFAKSSKSLKEHIDYINEYKIEKALIVAENIEFITQCPSLKDIKIIPSITKKEFDYSPLYQMTGIKKLECLTSFGHSSKPFTTIDYSQIVGLEYLTVVGKYGHVNVDKVKTLKGLYCSEGFPSSDSLKDVYNSPFLEELQICQSSIKCLDGIESAKGLKKVDLLYNSKLQDISSLGYLDNLQILEIEKCEKINDFSVLNYLSRVEELMLVGSNKLENMKFIQNMANLKRLIFEMNCLDGDLSLCCKVPYVSIKNRKHYSHKNNDFKKEI